MTEDYIKTNCTINNFGKDYKITITGNYIQATIAIVIYDHSSILNNYIAGVNVTII
jgi:hypothetical protein